MALATARKSAAKETHTELVSEGVGSSFKIDREACIVRGVKILGLESRNGRRYSPAAISAAKMIYEGVRVNLNHPKGSDAGKTRDYQDRLGIIRNVNEAADGLYADYHYNPKHVTTEQILWDIEHNPNSLGFSHVAKIREKKVNGKNVVEAIESVKSVDLVTDPATTKGVFENIQEETEMDIASLTFEELSKARPDLIQESLNQVEVREAAKAKDLELKTVKEQLEVYQGKEKLAAKQANVDKLVTEAKLPKEAQGPLFMEGLLNADSDEKIKALIAEQKALFGNVPTQKVISRGLVTEAVNQDADRDTFIKGIKSRRLSA